MANFASIRIEITTNPLAIDQGIQFQYSKNSNDVFLLELPRSLRTQTNRFTIGANINESADNLRDALFLDYKLGGLVDSLPLIIITDISGDAVIISATEYDVVFYETLTPSWANVTITPEVKPEPEFEIGNIFAIEADGTDKCTKAKYSFEVLNAGPGTYPIEISSPVSKTAVDEFDLFFDYDRNHIPQATLTIQPDDGDEISTLLPRVSSYAFDSVGVLESFSGATITLNTTKESRDLDTTFTYSLDDVDYQSSNVFYSVPAGNYTAYVLDSLGCKQSLLFTVEGVTVDKPEPYFKIENVNSVKMFPRTVFSPCGDRPNFDNSRIIDQGYWNIEKRNYLQLIQQCDNTNIQIKSNYDNIVLDVLDCDGEIVQSPPVTLVKQNILLQDKRDCQLKAGEEGKTHIYYISGNTYDPNTTDVNGSYAINNGVLPAFASDGNISSGITIELNGTSLSGVFLVQQAVYDADISAYVLEINAVFEGAEGEAAITQATYNDEDYNIHEVTIDWSIIPEGIYTLMSIATDDDPRYDTIYWDGEYINLKEEHKDSVMFKYSNPDNIEQADYSTGIEFYLRVPARFIKWRNGGESENFVADDGTREQLKGTVIREIQLETNLIPQYLVEKISIASIHKNLFLNGIECTLSEQGESEDKFTERNPFYYHNSWYQVGEPIEISDATGIISSTGRALEVNGNALGITI